MRDQHMNPAEAVQVMIDCGAKRAMAHHWGTVQLTNEGIEAPRIALAAALAERGVAPDMFRAIRPGEVWELPPAEAWSLLALQPSPQAIEIVPLPLRSSRL